MFFFCRRTFGSAVSLIDKSLSHSSCYFLPVSAVTGNIALNGVMNCLTIAARMNRKNRVWSDQWQLTGIRGRKKWSISTKQTLPLAQGSKNKRKKEYVARARIIRQPGWIPQKKNRNARNTTPPENAVRRSPAVAWSASALTLSALSSAFALSAARFLSCRSCCSACVSKVLRVENNQQPTQRYRGKYGVPTKNNNNN